MRVFGSDGKVHARPDERPFVARQREARPASRQDRIVGVVEVLAVVEGAVQRPGALAFGNSYQAVGQARKQGADRCRRTLENLKCIIKAGSIACHADDSSPDHAGKPRRQSPTSGEQARADNQRVRMNRLVQVLSW